MINNPKRRSPTSNAVGTWSWPPGFGFARTRCVADCCHQRLPRARHHMGAAPGHVRPRAERRIRSKNAGPLVDREALTGQGRLIQQQRGCIEDAGVAGNDVTRPQHQHIARHHFVERDLDFGPVRRTSACTRTAANKSSTARTAPRSWMNPSNALAAVIVKMMAPSIRSPSAIDNTVAPSNNNTIGESSWRNTNRHTGIRPGLWNPSPSRRRVAATSADNPSGLDPRRAKTPSSVSDQDR